MDPRCGRDQACPHMLHSWARTVQDTLRKGGDRGVGRGTGIKVFARSEIFGVQHPSVVHSSGQIITNSPVSTG